MAAFHKRLKYEDSRQHRRLRTHCLARYSYVSDPSSKGHLVTPRNFSTGGMLFISDSPIPKGTVLDIDIYLPPLKDFFTAMASVARVVKIKKTDQYWIGIRFTAMDPKEKEIINSYMQNLSKSSMMNRYLDRKKRNFKRKLPH